MYLLEISHLLVYSVYYKLQLVESQKHFFALQKTAGGKTRLMNLFRTTSRRLLPKRPTYHRTLFSLPSFPPSGEQTYHEQKIFPYKRSELYAIVSDVSSYPQFIPYCTGSRILHKATHDGSTIMDAELTVGFMAFQESYVSKVTCTPFSSVEVRPIHLVLRLLKQVGHCFLLDAHVQVAQDHMAVPTSRRKGAPYTGFPRSSV